VAGVEAANAAKVTPFASEAEKRRERLFSNELSVAKVTPFASEAEKRRERLFSN
jgi:hypothetical protein